MNTPLIEIALTEVYGPRCPEPEPGCPVCNAWHELDTLKAAQEARITPALIMDYAKVQRERDELKEEIEELRERYVP